MFKSYAFCAQMWTRHNKSPGDLSQVSSARTFIKAVFGVARIKVTPNLDLSRCC